MHALKRCSFAIAIALAACGPAKPHDKPPPHATNRQTGYASWYGESQMTASGERFDKHAMTAAHLSLPLGTRVRVTNQKNGKTVVVRINDRGPYGGHGRIINLSEAAARQLDMIEAGVVPIVLEVVK